MRMQPKRAMDGNAQAVLKEFLIALRFGAVGGVATAIHLVILFVLLSHISLSLFLANATAFGCAFGVSFLGNYRWTFGAPGAVRLAVLRFFVVSLLAFLVNNLVLAAMLQANWLEPTLSALVSALVIPVITFLASRFWAFKIDGVSRPD